MKKTVRICIALIALLLLLNGAAFPHSFPDAIRICYWHLPLNLPIMAAETWQSYEKAFPQSNVRSIPLSSGPKQMQAMAAQELDIVEGIGAAAFLTAAGNGLEAQIIGVNSRSPQAFAVVVKNPKIQSIKDLKGKKVVGLRASVVHQVFLDALREAGMTERDVEFFPMPVAGAGTALLAGRADAALLVGYEIRRAQKAGARILADGRGRVNGLSLIVARKAFAQQYPDAIQKYLNTRKAVVQKIGQEPIAVAQLASTRLGIPAGEIREMWKWYDFSTAMTSKDREEIKKTGQYLLQQRLIPAAIPPERLY